MEGLDKKFEKIASDSDKIIELYDYAEKVYPYQKIRNPESWTPTERLGLCAPFAWRPSFRPS